MLEVNGRTFLLYHRQDPAKAPICGFRFTCASELTFGPDGSLKLGAYVNDLGQLFNAKPTLVNLALNKPVFANTELPAKRTKMIRLIRSLRAKNVPLHAIGLQGHYELDQVPLADLEATLVAMRELGVKVVVSELDIDVIPRSKWWADGGKYRGELAQLNPYRDGCPPEILQRQAEQYAQLFQLFLKHADVIARISFWNLHDGQSWLNDFPWQRVNYPLLFDRNGQPKLAFEAVIKALSPPNP